jgi:hypothetical protein
MIMAENKPAESSVPLSAPPPIPPAPSSLPPQPASVNAVSPAPPVVRLDDVPTPYAVRRAWPASTWILIVVMALLLLILVILGLRSRRQRPAGGVGNETANAQENSDLSNYTAFVAKNRALLEDKSQETILTDEPFAGRAPLAARASGPLASLEIDAQLAALVDALRIRVQVMHGSQSVVRNQMASTITRGEYRGFKVQALEKRENNRIVAEEAQVITPKNGLIKTVGRVLAVLQKTDLPGVLAEIKAAGMDFSPIPPLGGEAHVRGRLRITGPWGKTLPRELLISGNGVGGLTLGVPVAGMNDRLLATYSVLKRKVLVKDSYHDVYKVMDQAGEPLFYIYEREGKVWGISIIGESFRTEQGIGINSTLDQIRLHYPRVTLAYSGKKTPFVRVDGVEGIFIVQNEVEKKVISIQLGASPEFE